MQTKSNMLIESNMQTKSNMLIESNMQTKKAATPPFFTVSAS